VEVEELNVLKPNKQTTIQTLLALGKGQREIARAAGIDRKTIRRYAGKAVPANSPGVATGSPEQNPPPRPPAHTSACEPWREFIEAQLELKRNAMAVPPPPHCRRYPLGQYERQPAMARASG
jgi:hypothetical protein